MRVVGAQQDLQQGHPPSQHDHPSSRLDFTACSDQRSSSRRRGLVMAADRTELLYQQGYWASYNLP